MNHSLLAGALVTLSLLLLCLERAISGGGKKLPTIFVVAYGLGVVFWLIMGVAINHIALVVISSLQLFFITLANALTKSK